MKMAILNREDLTARLQQRFGESENDDDIAFVEDITDTFNNLTEQDQTARIQELETELAEQKKKYRDRFFAPAPDGGNTNNTGQNEEQENRKPLRFEDLFTEVK